MSDVINVAVTGAAGQIGYTLLFCIGSGKMFGPNTQIGNQVKIQNNVSVYSGVELEDDVFLGPSMVFTNVINPRSQVNRRDEFQTTLVKRGATIGANATILCGITLGEYAFVGAGSVVTRDVPAYALVHGNPARIQGWMCQCGHKLKFNEEHGQSDATCQQCGKSYMKQGAAVTLIT